MLVTLLSTCLSIYQCLTCCTFHFFLLFVSRTMETCLNTRLSHVTVSYTFSFSQSIRYNNGLSFICLYDFLGCLVLESNYFHVVCINFHRSSDSSPTKLLYFYIHYITVIMFSCFSSNRHFFFLMS